ncbi:AAA family ATPase [Peptococcaceae bacterium 1198_IL3148]
MVKIKMWQNPERVEPAHKKEVPRRKLGPIKPVVERPSNYEEQNQHKGVKEIMDEINKLIGLESVKKLIKELHAFIEIQRLREKEKLAHEPMVLHMIFKGNPGTGKTTVARLLGQLFKEMGVLNKGHIIEVERADLVGEYIGHTAKRTRDQIKKALGGILFIDEAYSLARGGDKDFGKECIDCMVKSMEDNKDNLILILAGYQREMDDFIESNPGLRSRFPIHITFPDYTIQQLMEIATLMLNEREYKLTPEAEEQMRVLLKERARLHRNSGNARLVRNLIERSMRLQAVRLLNYKQSKLSREELMIITLEDIINAYDDLTEN